MPKWNRRAGGRTNKRTDRNKKIPGVISSTSNQFRNLWMFVVSDMVVFCIGECAFPIHFLNQFIRSHFSSSMCYIIYIYTYNTYTNYYSLTSTHRGEWKKFSKMETMRFTISATKLYNVDVYACTTDCLCVCEWVDRNVYSATYTI